MSKINLNGVTAEAVTGILVLAVALINAVLQMFGIKILPVTDDDIASLVSAVFLIVTAIWNTWKNRNITSASQVAQDILEAIKKEEIGEGDVRTLLQKQNTNAR